MELRHNKSIICLEGIVGSGKTTQINKLHQNFSPRSYLIPELNDISPMKEVRSELKRSGRISDPSYGDVTNIVNARGILHQIFLEESNEPIILMDRGLYTGMVFESGDFSMWEVERLSRERRVAVPDVCFFLYCSAEKALERVDERRVRVGKYSHRAFHENKEFINRTKERYFEIAKKRPIIPLDSSGDAEEVQNKILGEIYNAGIL